MEASLIHRFKTSIKQNLAASEASDRGKAREVEEEARSVQYYAKLLFVHPNHLNAVVKKGTGRPAITHIHQQLIQEAKFLLMGTGLSVKEIAYKLAFREPAHFHAFFRKHTSHTPNGFRRQFQFPVPRG